MGEPVPGQLTEIIVNRLSLPALLCVSCSSGVAAVCSGKKLFEMLVSPHGGRLL